MLCARKGGERENGGVTCPEEPPRLPVCQVPEKGEGGRRKGGGGGGGRGGQMGNVTTV